MGLGPAPLSLRGEDYDKLEKPQVYSGHRNSQTVKGVSFFGLTDEYVLTGSDCGHIFIWKKKDAKLVRMMVGDRNIVNQLKPHPCIPVLATCGIEKTIKLWAPTSKDVTPLPPPDVQEKRKLQKWMLIDELWGFIHGLHERQEDVDSDDDDGG